MATRSKKVLEGKLKGERKGKAKYPVSLKPIIIPN